MSAYREPAALSGRDLHDGPAVVHDPVGGPVGVAVAEHLAAAGRPVAIVSPDPVIGTLLALTGDLADASARLQRAGRYIKDAGMKAQIDAATRKDQVKPREGVRLLELYESQMLNKTYLNIERAPKRRKK